MMLNKNWYRDVRKVRVISMTKYWSSIAKRAEPYVPGLQINEPDMIKLNTNENPYAPSPKVWEAIQKEAGPNLRLYPSPTGDELRDTIGSRYGLSADEDRKSTRLNSSHVAISYAVFCLKKKKEKK